MKFNPMMIKTFMKGMGADKELLDGVDNVFAIKWAKPRPLGVGDLQLIEHESRHSAGADTIILEGNADGDPVTVVIQTSKGKLPEKFLKMLES